MRDGILEINVPSRIPLLVPSTKYMVSFSFFFTNKNPLVSLNFLTLLDFVGERIQDLCLKILS